ncbi:uncharacterized protein H6S33_007148 [Morchella sextelata]|uniref:uncharacterized protein n=1 Tax=Morchella sextelata TaxID=1174677 RepID=UPI001D04D5BE|nr:uncharacterized protein H6S33_007148 [Morchella sextelata]KAH0604117.1 hypothetical protein H6S33_007148 [Morchella sextelata]
MEVAASIVGLLAAGAQVTSILREFLSSVKNAPAIAKRLDDEVIHFQYIILKIDQTVIKGKSLDPDRAALVDINHLCAALTAAVSTFSELEKELDRIKARGKMDFWDRLKWSRAEKNLLNISLRLNRHETSLTLIFTILTSESVTRALSSKERLSGEFDAESLAVNQADSDAASQSNDGSMSNASTGTTSNPLVGMHEFESSLSSSRAYRRARDSDSIFSLETLQSRIGRWSMYTAYSNDSVFSMPISLREVAGVSLADKAIAPVLLPIAVDTIYHNDHYRTSPPHELMKGPTPKLVLYAAAREGRYEEVRDLLRRGLDVNETGPNGDTTLDVAFQNLHMLTIEILLLFGARISQPPNYYEFLDLTIKQGGRHIFQMILKRCPHDHVSLILDGLFSLSLRSANMEPYSFALGLAHHLDRHIYIDILESASQRAAALRDEAAIKSMFQDSIRVGDGLHAIQRVLLKQRSPEPELISFALEKVAQLDTEQSIHLALSRRVKQRSLPLIGLLFGVNTYGAVVDGPLRVFLQPADRALVKFLLALGIDGEADPYIHVTLLDPAFLDDDRENPKTILHSASLTGTAEIGINATDGNGSTALHLALQEGSWSTAHFLIGGDADVNRPNILGNIPLMIVAAKYSMGAGAVIDHLVSRGTNLNAIFPSGGTILHFAAEYEETHMVGELLRKGADKYAQDHDGRTPDQCTHNKEIVRMIQDYKGRGPTKTSPFINKLDHDQTYAYLR